MSAQPAESTRVPAERLPFPILGWEETLQTFDPMSVPTPARARTWRAHGYATRGIVVTTRANGRATGRKTFFSALVALSARSRLSGDTLTAEVLVTSAEEIEREFADRVASFLQERTLLDLPDAPFYAALLDATRRALIRSAGWQTVLFARAEIGDVDAVDAHLVGVTTAGEPASIDVPRRLVDSWQLGSGDGVLVFRYLAGRSAVLDMLPASPHDEIDPQVRFDEALERVRARAARGAHLPQLAALEKVRPAPRRRLRPAG